MILSGINAGVEATRAGAEGQAALSVGETERARREFEQAGKILVRKITGCRKPADKHLTRFLAASQYYHGGHYQKALDLSRKVEAKFLPAETRPVFDRFLRHVKDRAAPAYESSVRKQLTALWLLQDYGAILSTLQDNPYIFNQAGLAFLRAVCCERLEDYQGAAVFFADAIRADPVNPNFMFTAAGRPLQLIGSGRLEEAWKYVNYQLKVMPNAVTLLTASNIRFHQGHKVDDQEKSRKFLRESVHYFEHAWQLFQKLPASVSASADLRDYMVMGFEIAALALDRMGDSAGARDVCSTAISYAPNAYGPKTVRGTITYPSADAVADFRRAVELGDPSYYAYYFLAHASLVSADYEAAASWCQQALQHTPSRRIGAQLYLWFSIARRYLGASIEEVRSLLQQAIELDPDNPMPRQHLKAADAAGKHSSFSSELEWGAEIAQPSYLDYLEAHESKFEAAWTARTSLPYQDLASVGA